MFWFNFFFLCIVLLINYNLSIDHKNKFDFDIALVREKTVKNVELRKYQLINDLQIDIYFGEGQIF